MAQVLGAVDAERTGHLPVLDVEDEELAGLPVTPPDLLVPVVRGPYVLEAAPVRQVAEEVGHDLIWLRVTHHCPRRVLPLLEGHVPMLDPNAPAMDPAVVRADVTGRIAPLHRSPQSFLPP